MKTLLFILLVSGTAISLLNSCVHSRQGSLVPSEAVDHAEEETPEPKNESIEVFLGLLNKSYPIDSLGSYLQTENPSHHLARYPKSRDTIISDISASLNEIWEFLPQEKYDSLFVLDSIKANSYSTHSGIYTFTQYYFISNDTSRMELLMHGITNFKYDLITSIIHWNFIPEKERISVCDCVQQSFELDTLKRSGQNTQKQEDLLFQKCKYLSYWQTKTSFQKKVEACKSYNGIELPGVLSRLKKLIKLN